MGVVPAWKKNSILRIFGKIPQSLKCLVFYYSDLCKNEEKVLFLNRQYSEKIRLI